MVVNVISLHAIELMLYKKISFQIIYISDSVTQIITIIADTSDMLDSFKMELCCGS